MRDNTDLVLGGMGAAAGAFEKFNQHQEQQKPLSVEEQLIYKIAMGELDPDTGAAMLKRGMSPAPTTQMGPGLGAAVPQPQPQADHTNVSLAPGMASDALSPTAMGLAAQRPSTVGMTPTPAGARINPTAGPPAPRTGLGAPPTRRDFGTLMTTAQTVGPLISSRRNLERETLRQDALDGRFGKGEEGRNSRLFTSEQGKDRRQGLTLDVKREELDQSKFEFSEMMKYRWGSLKNDEDMLKQRLSVMERMNSARIGSDQRVNAIKTAFQRINNIDDNIARIVTSINSLAKDPAAVAERQRLESELSGWFDQREGNISRIEGLTQELEDIAGSPAPRQGTRSSTTTKTTGGSTATSGGGQVGAQQPQSRTGNTATDAIATSQDQAIPQTGDQFLQWLQNNP